MFHNDKMVGFYKKLAEFYVKYSGFAPTGFAGSSGELFKKEFEAIIKPYFDSIGKGPAFLTWLSCNAMHKILFGLTNVDAIDCQKFIDNIYALCNIEEKEEKSIEARQLAAEINKNKELVNKQEDRVCKVFDIMVENSIDLSRIVVDTVGQIRDNNKKLTNKEIRDINNLYQSPHNVIFYANKEDDNGKCPLMLDQYIEHYLNNAQDNQDNNDKIKEFLGAEQKQQELDFYRLSSEALCTVGEQIEADHLLSKTMSHFFRTHARDLFREELNLMAKDAIQSVLTFHKKDHSKEEIDENVDDMLQKRFDNLKKSLNEADEPDEVDEVDEPDEVDEDSEFDALQKRLNALKL